MSHDQHTAGGIPKLTRSIQALTPKRGWIFVGMSHQQDCKPLLLCQHAQILKHLPHLLAVVHIGRAWQKRLKWVNHQYQRVRRNDPIYQIRVSEARHFLRLFVEYIGIDHHNLAQISTSGSHTRAQHSIDRIFACKDHNVARALGGLWKSLRSLAHGQGSRDLCHKLPLAYTAVTAKQRNFTALQTSRCQHLMIFRCHIAQPLKHNTTPVQNIQLKLHCSPGEAYGRCIGRDILYRPLVSRLYLHGQLQQVRVQNVISFHLHILPCSNKFLALFRFQGAPPHFHRAAACSAVQGQLPSRLGHRPSRRAHLSRCRARPGLARPLSPPWAHNHITLFMNCPVYFEKSFTRRAARHLWTIFLIFFAKSYVGSKNSLQKL